MTIEIALQDKRKRRMVKSFKMRIRLINFIIYVFSIFPHILMIMHDKKF